MTLFVPQKTEKNIELFESDTMKDVIELAHTIFWSILSRNIMLEYNSPECTVEFKERTRIGLNPDQKVHIPTIELYSRPPQVTDKNPNYFALFSPSDPERIGIHPRMLDYCKRITKDSHGYNRIVFFGAISIVHEFCHLKHYTFKELRGTVNVLESLNEAGVHYEFQLLQGRLVFIFKTSQLIIESVEAGVKLIKSPEADYSMSEPKKRKMDENDINQSKSQSDVFFTNVKLHQTCLVKKIKKGDEHKYILVTTIENTSETSIEIPKKADPGVLNLRLTSTTRGGINPNERIKITRCIENMVGPRRTISPGQTHTYKFVLNDLFKLPTDLYQIKCHLTLICSERKMYFLTDVASYYFLVESHTEKVKTEVTEKLTLELDPEFIKVINFNYI